MYVLPEIEENIPQGDMPGDKIEFHPDSVEKAKKLFPYVWKELEDNGVIDNENARFVIAVSGGSGVGKTTIASVITYYLNKNGVGAYTHSGDNYPRRVPEENDAERMSRYEKGGRDALADYLGTNEEINFEALNDNIRLFKAGVDLIPLRRMGRKADEVWYDIKDFSDTKVLVIEWTHGNSEFLNEIDLPIFLYSTPEETRAVRIARGRNENAASPFISMVLEIEQGKLNRQGKMAKIMMDMKGNVSFPSRKNIKVLLNAYPDSCGGNLKNTVDLLKKEEVKDAFSGFYILPSIFNSDLDRGFSVISYDLNKELGSEKDMEELRELGINLKLDFVLNHLSVNSPEFKDVLEKGQESKYADFFINWNKFWEGHGSMCEEGYIIPDKQYTDKMFFRKPGLPILMLPMPDGTKVPYWNTFYQEIIEEGKSYLGQMDLNIQSDLVWEYYENVLKTLSEYGASIVRLDAFAYAPKAVGEKNFLNEPDTWNVLSRVQEIADKYGLTLLPEIHASYAEGIYNTLADKGYMNYDFFLPGLLIDAFDKKDGTYIVKWIQEIIDKKIKTVNMLGCHDGIPVLDLKGLLPEERIQQLIDTIVTRGGYVKDLHGQKNMYYQVNATYFSALGEDENRLLLARAIQLFMPGIPQIWYLDLFAGKNDYEAVKRAGEGGHKEINRTNLTNEQIEAGLKQSIVLKQLEMIKLRNSSKAFMEDAAVTVSFEDKVMKITRAYGSDKAELVVDFEKLSYRIQ